MINRDIFGPLPKSVRPHIIAEEIRHHSKASEAYIDATFIYSNKKNRVSVPVNYRRTGVDAQTAEECIAILQVAYESFFPSNLNQWINEANVFWADGGKVVTRPFFEVMKGKLGNWVCQGCELPTNANWARRTQDIKEMGYTFATNTKKQCAKCGGNKTHLMLLPIQRGSETGYETWSPQLRTKIMRSLECYDAYEDCNRPAASLLPDHKFPEIRWDADTRTENSDEMSPEEIRSKFQLLTNQRNQQKREVCRQCYQTGIRGKPFGIEFYYEGSSKWPQNIPKNGQIAEKGCLGCGWYDLQTWRKALNAGLRPYKLSS